MRQNDFRGPRNQDVVLGLHGEGYEVKETQGLQIITAL